MITLALQRIAKADFALAIVIFPGVVEKIDAGVDCLADNLVRFLIRVGGPEVKAANAQCRNLQTGLAERALGNASRLSRYVFYEHTCSRNTQSLNKFPTCVCHIDPLVRFPRVVGQLHPLFGFFILHIFRKTVSDSGLRVVIFDRDLE